MPLPSTILRSVVDPSPDGTTRFAVSGGSELAFVGSDEAGRPQIFVARLDGSGIHQVTHDPRGADSPAWSPDGTSLAYVASGSGHVRNLFIVDVTTGGTEQITDGVHDLWGPSFSPDGSSLIYTDPGEASDAAEMRIVPIDGGASRILFGGIDGRGGMGHAGGGSLSPNGSLATMTGNEVGGPGAAVFVSNIDGTDRRVIGAYGTAPAGTWSPDGRRFVCLGYSVNRIIVVDLGSGTASRVAEGRGAIWLDDHTLLVER
jgi:Tol biopolymer transport system component